MLALSPPPRAERDELRRSSREEYPALPKLVALAGGVVYFVDPALHLLARVEAAGGEARVLGRIEGNPDALSVHEGAVYVHDSRHDGDALIRFDPTAGTPGVLLAMAHDAYLPFGPTTGGTAWVDDDDLLTWSSAGGFLSLGRLALLPEREPRAPAPEDFATLGTDVFFSQSEDTSLHSGKSRVVRRGLAGAYSILAMNFEHPTLLTPTAEAVYVVEGGFAGGIMSNYSRIGCCAIWAVGR
jgi:hypothetical protein